MIAWACLAILTGFAHGNYDGNPVTLRLGMAFEFLSVYLWARTYIINFSDVLRFSKCLVIILVPLAMIMLIEKISGQNLYEPLGAAFKMLREGHRRIAGPFGNAILAGTAGGTSFPFMILLFHYHRAYSIIGIVATCVIVYCSSSSGPYLTIFSSIFALLMWRWRNYLVWFRNGVVATLIGLHLVMSDPVWYLSARIDIGGGSTGYHRAELISQALNHIDEWWLTGSDYTRHWIAYGIEWSTRHADITNFYLKMGVLGGLSVMIAFVGILSCTFGLIGRKIRDLRLVKDSSEFTLWCLGASLFAHCVSFLGVAYYDQSYVLLFLIIGTISGLANTPLQSYTNNANANANKKSIKRISRYKPIHQANKSERKLIK